MTVRVSLRRVAPWLTLSLAALCPLLQAAPADSDGARYFEGKAYATANGKLAYTEAHWTYGQSGTMSELVLYQCPDGRPFARKISQSRGNADAPDFKLEDARSGYQEGVREQGGKRLIFVRAGRDAKERTAALNADPSLVIDGGFDAYVRQHWQQLKAGDKASFRFAVPAQLDTMSFSLEREPDKQVDGRTVRIYRLSLDSLLSFALPHIDVAYDAQSQQLLRFDGLTNIHASNGKNLRARVTFDPTRNKQVSEADQQSALKQPLDGRCSFP